MLRMLQGSIRFVHMSRRRLIAATLGLGGTGLLAIFHAEQTYGDIGTFPYPAWFLAASDQQEDQLIFRKYGYEGMARNLFVLFCKKSGPITVEIIPPKSLEKTLRDKAKFGETQSRITIRNNDSGFVFSERGGYDKIAAFIDFRSDDHLFKFLEVTSQPRLNLAIEAPRISYVLVGSDAMADAFKRQFPMLFDKAKVTQLSWQDVYIRCGKFRDRAG